MVGLKKLVVRRLWSFIRSIRVGKVSYSLKSVHMAHQRKLGRISACPVAQILGSLELGAVVQDDPMEQNMAETRIGVHDR